MIKSGLIPVLCLLAGPLHGAGSASSILNESGVKGGLVVVVGCDNPELLVDLGRQDGYLVQGLDTQADHVQKAIEAIDAEGLYGKVSVSRYDGGPLPYIDNLVNLLIVSNADGKCDEKEIRRVLAPRGVAIVDGKKITGEVAPGLDDWTHHMYNASAIGAGGDTVVSQPRSMQWKAGPEYSRSHENMSSVSAVVSAGGRVFSIMDEGPKASIYLPSKWFLSARDAFSGVLLWKVPISEWHAALHPLKSGPQQLPRRLVAVGDRVYVTLGITAPVSELDAATGEVLRTFEGTANAEEILHTGGKLVVLAHSENASSPYKGNTPKTRIGFVLNEKTLNLQGNRTVMLVDVASGKVAWKTPPEPVVSTTVVAGGGKVIYMNGDQLTCLDMAGGKKLWSEKVTAKALAPRTTVNPTVLVHKDVVYTAVAGNLTARDMANGKTMWTVPCAPSGYTAPASIFVINGLIWDIPAGGEPYRPGSNLDDINRYYIGYDLRTGEERQRVPATADHGYAIMHHRCHIPRASGTNIITSFPGIEFFDLVSGKVTHDSWIRGACLYGFMPANGLLYTPPHPCACYMQSKLSGFWAVTGKRPANQSTEIGAPLEKGPAYAVKAKGQATAGDWATYRGDAARSGVTKIPVPAKVDELWTTEVGEGLSQCVIAEGKLFVSTADKHRVHAINADTGDKLWEYTAGARVDSAPTFYRGTVIFGSHDGYVYCLTADKGELAWRFRAAPTDSRSVAYDQVESVWPVHGSVLIHEDTVWLCAGRSSYLDGGLYVYRLKPGTGEMLSMTRINSLESKDEQKPIEHTIYARLDMEGAKNDILSCDGDNVFLRHWALDLKGKTIPQDIDHLFSPTGFLDTSWFRRTYWIHGQIYVGGAQGWARTGNVRPTGRIMSLDDDIIYGFGRDWYPPSPGNAHQMYLAGEQENFFAATRSGPGVVAPDESKPKKKRAAKKKQVLWSASGDIQTRAMLLAGEGKDKRLLVAGAKGDWVISQKAYSGEQGNVLRVMSIEDGSTISEQELPATPIFDGMSAARGRLYISLTDGRVLCLGEK